MTTRAKALLINIFFHFVVLGVGVRLLFFPNLPDGHWFVLLVMTFFMDPIVAYLFGWSMNMRTTVGADAPKSHRFFTFVVGLISYMFIFLIWMGVIGHWYD
ncbi:MULTISPECIES: hypothetical protein [Mariprofundus]|uniref:Uncharacterized protein n=2 Tax=Mariprofundus TaxID=377315 RepID=A0A5R9GQK1_9PROT|nr:MULTISPECIES: hypothetical protein [Mariprofundus]EAU54223.1 hypothetical protein SPV1_05662 [Mariprofundus ferrooxydans PV-1]KON47771.1 hypothetical protein AL013_06035 [Mariprofundus ferrooxydans]TLS67209.1 hypothetical protein FEF65_07135 [Mariprofundus erugo]